MYLHVIYTQKLWNVKTQMDMDGGICKTCNFILNNPNPKPRQQNSNLSMSKCVCDINLCTQVDRAFVLFCSEVQIQHFSPWWHPGREVLLFLGDRQLLFPSKTKQDAYCLTLLRKSTEQAEIVTMLCEILPYGVVKHHVFNRPLLEHDGDISFLHLNYISVSLDCCYAVARVICGVYNCNSHNPICLAYFSFRIYFIFCRISNSMCFLFMNRRPAGEQIEDDGVSDSEVLLRGLDVHAFRAQSVCCAD